MQQQPLVSVIMPVYNAARYLHKAISSILQQTFSNFEFIIINDCSTDDSEAIIFSFNDDRIVYYKQPTNSGVVTAMNKGLELSKGKYIAVMHADDICFDNRLEKQIALLETNENVAVVAGKSISINDDDKPTGQVWKLDESTITASAIKKAMLVKNCISHPTTMMRAAIVKQYGYQSSPSHKGFAVEDYPLWLNMLADGYVIEKLNEPVLYYRVHSSSATGTFLRSKNPYFVNYHSKQFYLQQRKEKGKLNSFDKQLQRTMYMDYMKAKLKNLKAKLVGK